MFDNGDDLAAQVLHFLDAPDKCASIALAAHQLAVPSFSTDSRVKQIYNLLEPVMKREKS